MERIKDLDLNVFCTQGTVGVGVLIRTCIVWSREEDSDPIQRWIPCGPKFFLPVKVLSVVFRGKFLTALELSPVAP